MKELGGFFRLNEDQLDILAVIGTGCYYLSLLLVFSIPAGNIYYTDSPQNPMQRSSALYLFLQDKIPALPLIVFLLNSALSLYILCIFFIHGLIWGFLSAPAVFIATRIHKETIPWASKIKVQSIQWKNPNLGLQKTATILWLLCFQNWGKIKIKGGSLDNMAT